MKKNPRHILLVTFCFLCKLSLAQDTALVHTILLRIAAQQIKNDAFFIPGIFPSYIANHAIFSTQKKDNNIFYNGLISLTLKNLYAGLPQADKLICDSIFASQSKLFSKFKNKKGRQTYNFWRTDSAFIFPYTSWIHLIKKSPELPDDMDDTVLSLLAQTTDSTEAAAVHSLMQAYTNSDTSKVRILLTPYRNIPAYSTWFGKKFPVVFDMSVLCNVLGFVQKYNLPWQKADSASLQFFITVLNNKDHIHHPGEVSPYYGNTSIILYHLARLMSIKEIPELEELKINLITDAVNQLANTDNLLEKIMLSTAIYKWGYTPPPLALQGFETLIRQTENNNLPFFIGNIPSYLPDAQKRFFKMNKLGLFYHYCPAYNATLLLEYLVLKNKK